MYSARSKMFFHSHTFLLFTQSCALNAIVLLGSVIGWLPAFDNQLFVAVCSTDTVLS